MCKDHEFCVPIAEAERIPVEMRVPYPLPTTVSMQESMGVPSARSQFLKGFDENTYGETGPQKKGTKTVPTQYSLDHYVAQQWKLDVDNFPYSLPEQLQAVQHRFGSYISRGVQQVKINQSAKPTLSKKLSEWERARLESQLRQLELLYSRSNKNPKILKLLTQFHEENPKVLAKGQRKPSPATQPGKKKQGKYSDPKEFRLDDSRDMVPLVYQDTMNVNPLIMQLQKEHDEIMKMQAQNPGLPFAELAQKYYEKKEKKEKDEIRKKVLSKSSLGPEEKSNYLPSCKAVKKRMDSEHLNTWLVRSEIQYAAERQIEFNNMLKRSPREKSRQNVLSVSVDPASKPEDQLYPKTTASRVTPKFVMSCTTRGTLRKMYSPTTAKSLTTQDLQLQTGSRHTQLRNRPMSTTQPLSGAARTRPRPFSSGTYFVRNRQNHMQRLFSARPYDKARQEDQDNDQATINASSMPDVEVINMDEDPAIPPHGISHDFVSPRMNPMTARSDRVPTSGLLVGKKQQQSVPIACQEAQRRNQGQAGPQLHTDKKLAQQQEPSEDQSQSQQMMRSYKVIVSTNTGKRKLKTEVHQNSMTASKPSKKSRNHQLLSSNGTAREDSTHASFSENGDALACKSSSRLPNRSRIHTDLVEACDSTGHVAGLFKSSHYQRDKNRLISSMGFHMHRHRARLLLSPEQEKRRTEQASRFMEGNQLLQRNLSRRYGISEITDFQMPRECEQQLKEQHDLHNSKKLRDSEMYQRGTLCRNTSSRATLEIRSFNQLHNRSLTHRSDISKPSETQRLQQPSSMISLESAMGTNQEKKQLFSEVPIDPKPDVLGITSQRFDFAKDNFMKKVENDAHKPRSEWRRKSKARKSSGPDDINALDADQVSPGSNGLEHQLSSHHINANTLSSSVPCNQSPTNLSRQASAKNMRQAPSLSQTQGASWLSHRSNKTLADASTFEVASPGIGAPLRGLRLKKLTQDILQAIDVEIVDTLMDEKTVSFMMPECQRDALWLRKHFVDMESPDFWLQKGLVCSREGKSDYAMDYYRQGLRKNPTNESLLYSLAQSYLRVQKYESAIRWFSFGLGLNPRWVDGLCGVAVAFFNMKYYEKSLSYIEHAKNNFKSIRNRVLPTDPVNGERKPYQLPSASQLSYNQITLILATCLKKTNRFDQASNVYLSLEEAFRTERSRDLIALLWGCILVPLADERRIVADHYRGLQEVLEHFNEVPLPNMEQQNLLLSRFCKDALKDKNGYTVDKLVYQDYQSPPKVLDFATYPRSILALLEEKSFFCRFKNLLSADDIRVRDEILGRAEVELYRRDQPVFLNNRVAIVTMGAVEIRTHNEHALLKPTIIRKAIEGDVIGSEMNEDTKMILSPLCWLMSLQDQTEVVYLSREDFKELFSLLRKFTEQRLVLHKLNQNKFFRQLLSLTKYHFVFECLDLKKFFPGQLIMSVHIRSPLSPCFKSFFQDSASKFRKELDSKIMNQIEKNHTSMYQGLLSALNASSAAGDDTGNLTFTMRTKSEESTYVAEETLNSDKDLMAGTQHAPNTSVQNQTPTYSQAVEGRRRRLKALQKVQIGAGIADEVSSNSTDYGVEHCHQIMNDKSQPQKKQIEKEECVIQDDYDDLNDELEKDAATHANDYKYPASAMTRKKPEKYLEWRSRSSSRSPNKFPARQKTDARSLSPAKTLQNVKVTSFSGVERATTTLTSARRRQRNVVVTNFREPEMPLNNIEESSNDCSDFDRSNKIIISPVTGEKFELDDFKTAPEDTAMRKSVQIKPTDSQALVTPKIIKLNHLEINSHKQQNSLTSFAPLSAPGKSARALNQSLAERKKSPTSQQMVHYNFFCQRYLGSIKQNDKATKKELKHRKAQLKYMLSFVVGLDQLLKSSEELNDSKGLKQALNTYVEQFDADKVSLEDEYTLPVGSSGFWNSHLVEKMGTIIEGILRKVTKVEYAQEILLKFLVKQIDSKYPRQLDPAGIHFIADGDVYVLGADGSQNMKLTTSDCFGHSDVFKINGPEYLGDVRAGLAPVHTYFLAVEKIKKRLSITEKLKLYDLAGQTDRLITNAISGNNPQNSKSF